MCHTSFPWEGKDLTLSGAVCVSWLTDTLTYQDQGAGVLGNTAKRNSLWHPRHTVKPFNK